MSEQRQWHRLFGAAWMDRVHAQPITVEVEKDLSLQQQRLDVLLVRATEDRPITIELPDGFDDFGRHNLITFKTYRETLTGYSLNELIGHYVAYRKFVSDNPDDLLPETDFRLYAVSARYPQALASRRPLRELSAGVYESEHHSGTLRVIVPSQLPRVERNALLVLFAASRDQVEWAARTYELRSPAATGLLRELFKGYQKEGMPMPYTLEDFRRDAKKSLLEDLTIEERLEGVPVEKRLEGVPAEKRLEGLSPEEEEELLRRLLAKHPQTPPEAPKP